MTEDSSVKKDGKEPVLVVMKGGYLVQAGKPECLTKKEALEYATGGYTMKTITIDKFRKTKWKWIYDKQKA
jgi:hypothetical protein